MAAKAKPAKAKTTNQPGMLARIRSAMGDRSRVLNLCGAVLGGATAIAAAGCLIVGYKPLVTLASDMRRSSPRIEIAWPLIPLPPGTPPGTLPMTWLDSESRVGLERLVSRQLGENPLDGRAIAGAHEALMATGWFDASRGGVRVTRHDDGIVRVNGVWRVPTAAVRVGEADYLVAKGGELLFPTYKRDGSGFKVILGVSHDLPEHGKAWVGGDVQAGLGLLAFLASMPGYQQVYGIDVSEYVNGKQLVVVTDQGNRIVWGGAPSAAEFAPGQAKPEKKREELAKLYATYGRIDAGRAVVDVRPEAGAYIHVAEMARTDRRR